MVRWARPCFATLLIALCVSAQESDEALAQRAVAAERQGDFAQAVKLFEQLIAHGADSPELRSNLGIAYFQAGDFQHAAQQFRIVLAKEPAAEGANLFLGLALAKLQQPKEGLVYLRRANRAQPDNPATLEALAQTEVAASEITNANEHFRRVTTLDASNAEAWYGLSITDRILAEAKSKAAATDTHNVVSARADAKRASGLMDDSEKALAAAVKLDPNSVRAYMILGESLRIAERYDAAIHEYEMAVADAPKLAPAWAGLAAAYSAAGDDQKGLAAAKRAAELDPNDPETNTLIAAIYVRMSDMDKAEPYIRRALQERPGLASAHVVLAKIYVARQQYARALPDLQAAAPEDVDGSTNYLLATTLRRLGKTEQAAKAMKEYERLHQARVAQMK